MTDPQSLLGKQLGQYTLQALLGSGGMASVYLARQESLNRDVAVKVLLQAADADFALRFQNEARLIAELAHPRILPVYDFGVEGDIPYIVMRLAEGGTLADKIPQVFTDLQVVGKIVEQLAEGLDFAHQAGVVHRDLKPQNIFLDSQGNVMLGDFGIAFKILSSSELTQRGILGTPLYASPEQFREEPCDARSDIYSLGVILYELVTGSHPFRGATMGEIILKHLLEPLPDPCLANPALSPGVYFAIRRATEKRSQDRYPSASEAARAFYQAISVQPSFDASRTPVLAEQLPSPPRAAPEEIPGRSLLPLAPPPYAIARRGLLNRIQQAVLDPEIPIVALRGMGGSGKSVLIGQLARAAQITGHFSDGILYYSLGPEAVGEAAADPALLGWANAIHREDEVKEYATPQERSSALAGFMSRQKRLLIIDDVWALAPLTLLAGVRGPDCKVLVTTRSREVSVGLGAYEIEVGGVNSEDARTLIEKRLGRGLSPDEVDTTRDISQRLGNLPLALSLATSQIQFGAYWEDILALLQEAAPDLSLMDVADTQQRELSLGITFDLSYKALTPEQQKAYRKLAVIPDGGVIDAQMAAAIWGVPAMKATQLLRHLANQSLLIVGEERTWYQHQLVRADARRRLLSEAAESTSAASAHARFFLEHIETLDFGVVHDHILAILNRALRGLEKREGIQLGGKKTPGEWLIETVNVIETQWQAAGFYQEQLFWLEKAYQVAFEAANWVKLSQFTRRLAEAHGQLGQYPQALEWLDRGQNALASSKLEAQGDLLARLAYQRAVLHFHQGQFAEAEQICKQALADLRPAEQNIVGSLLNVCGGAHYVMGHYAQAAEYYQQSLQIWLALGDAFQSTRIRDNLALVHKELGQWQDALDQFTQSLAYWRGVHHQDNTARICNNLGLLYLIQGKLPQAQDCFQEAFAIWQTLETPRSLVLVHANLANLHATRQDWEAAQVEAQQAVQLAEETGAAEALSYAYFCLAWGTLGQNKLAIAQAAAQKALALAQENQAQDDEAYALRMLGQVQHRLGDLSQAEANLSRSIQILESLNDPLQLGRSQAALGELYQATDRGDMAGEIIAQAIHTFAKLGAQIDLVQAKGLHSQGRNAS